MYTFTELARDLLLAEIGKSGVREWESSESRAAMVTAALEMAEAIWDESFEEVEMVAKLLVQEMDGTPKQIVFADHAGDFSPTAANDLRITTDGTKETDVQMALTGLANGSYYQSAKFDFGENRADEYVARLAVEIAATPTAGNTIDVWLAPSHSGTAATGNAGGVSGSAGSYAGYSSNAAASVKQLQYIGSFTVTAQATATVQIAEGFRFSPRERYGSLVLLNGSGAAFHSDDVEINLVLDPVIPESQ